MLVGAVGVRAFVGVWLTVACLGLVPAASAAELELPTSMLTQYYGEARARGAEASEPLARALVFASRQYPTRQRIRLLEQASAVDPALPGPHLERAWVLLRTGDFPGACVATRDAGVTVLADAVQQATLLRRVFWVLHTLLLVTLGTLVVLLLLRLLPFAYHVLDIQARRPLVVVGVAGLGIAGAFFVSPVLGVLASTAALLPFASRKERRVLAALCIGLALSEFGLPWMRPHAVLLDPSSWSASIARAQAEGWDPSLESRLAREVPAGRERDLALGLQARRRGDLATARRYYVGALRADSTWATAYVNLANVFFIAGDYDQAAAGYRSAESLAPESPLPYGNLAQTYIRMLHFKESDTELRAAAENGYDAVSTRREAWTHDAVPVLDVHLSAAELLRYARREARAKPEYASQLLLPWRGEAWRKAPIQVAPWLLVAFAGVLLSRLRYASWAFECGRCVRVACTHCAQSIRDTRTRICRQCDAEAAFERPASASNWSRRAADARSAKRLSLQPPRMGDLAPAWLAALFPGGADLVTGSAKRAAWTALWAWCAVLATVALAHASAERSTPWFVSLHPTALRISVALFWLMWLSGLLRLRRHKPRHDDATIPEGA